MTPPTPMRKPIGKGSLESTGSIAKFTSLKRHRLEPGHALTISGARDPYDGGFRIKSVPTPASFTYEMSATPGSAAAPTATAYSFWQIDRVLASRNEVDLRL